MYSGGIAPHAPLCGPWSLREGVFIRCLVLEIHRRALRLRVRSTRGRQRAVAEPGSGSEVGFSRVWVACWSSRASRSSLSI